MFLSGFESLPIVVAALSKAWARGHPLTGIEGSNPAGVCLLCCVLCTKDKGTRQNREDEESSKEKSAKSEKDKNKNSR